jgi:hypothetical protein
MTGETWTSAQRAALKWLPSDGSWRDQAGIMGTALSSLALCHHGLVESQWAQSGPRGGIRRRWRLTSVGVAAKTAQTT